MFASYMNIEYVVGSRHSGRLLGTDTGVSRNVGGEATLLYLRDRH